MIKVGYITLTVVLGLLAAGPARAALPEISIADASGAEGDSAATFVPFSVTLSAPSASDVTVQPVISYGTTSSDDHKPSGDTITIAAGQTSTTFYLAVFADVTVEPDETFAVTLSNPVGATIARGTATGTIRRRR